MTNINSYRNHVMESCLWSLISKGTGGSETQRPESRVSGPRTGQGTCARRAGCQRAPAEGAPCGSLSTVASALVLTSELLRPLGLTSVPVQFWRQVVWHREGGCGLLAAPGEEFLFHFETVQALQTHRIYNCISFSGRRSQDAIIFLWCSQQNSELFL